MSDELPAGKPLDAFIADKIFGGPMKNQQWYWWRHSTPSLDIDPPIFAGPRFSTDVRDAELIIAAWDGDVTIKRRNNLWHVQMTQPCREWGAWAETLPLAVCRCALKATES